MPPLPTGKQFIQGLANQRQDDPPSLQDLCAALDNHQIVPQGATADQQATSLYIVYDACRRWLKQYPSAPTGGKFRNEAYQSWKGKKDAVTALRDDVVSQIDGHFPGLGGSLVQYEDRKKGGAAKKLQALQPGYALERQTFLESKTSGAPAAPFSGSKVRSLLETDAQLPTPQYTGLGSFHKLNTADFQTLGAKVKGGARMYWCNRMQRLKNRVDYWAGTDEWRTIAGAQVHHEVTDANSFWADDYQVRPYAMDRYGNLFVDTSSEQYAAVNHLAGPGKAAKAADAVKARGYTNHSSICAGREVMCAGNLFIWKGQLLHIDNDSGHYAPTREHLRKAVKKLTKETGVPTAYLRVGVKLPSGALDLYTFESFIRGRTNPDWPNQAMKQDHKAIFLQKAAAGGIQFRQ
jgi:hypothetical protein